MLPPALLTRTSSPPKVSTAVVTRLFAPSQSATSAPFYGGLALLSAAGIEPSIRYRSIALYASVALSLPTLTALAVGWVRRRPDSAAGRAFEWARTHPERVTRAATWAVAVLLVVLGVAHVV